MKIYTKTGDDGTTGLFGGGRVSKASHRLECYGTVDELNSVLGVVLSLKPGAETTEYLSKTQDILFVLGADLATPRDSRAKVDRIENVHIEELESWIDTLDNRIAPLRSFILPGGTPAAAQLHFARTVCRRAERLCVAAAEQDPIGFEPIQYLNRLSDFLFVLARWENHSSSMEETPWRPR